MLWTASLCFFGFLRSGEITVPSDAAFDEGTHLSFSDVTVDRLDDPSRLKVSKTDLFRVGVEVCMGRSGCSLCPDGGKVGLPSSHGPQVGSAIQICG